MKDRTQGAIVTAVIALLLAALACTCISPRPTIVAPTAIPQADASAVPSLPPAPTDAVALTNTPVPDVPGPGECSLNAKFATDVTIPDGTALSPDANFVKVWRMRNSGTCTWEAGTKLVFSSGDQMGGPADVPVTAPVAPGAEVDISVNLKAPGTPGNYQGKWQLQSHTGTFFGSAIWVKIVVPEAATNTPTPLPGPMCTPPSCPAGEVAICPGPCTGGCGMVCATVTPPSGCTAVDAALHSIHEHASISGYELGCATGPAFYVQKNGDTGAYQEFWNNWDDVNPHTHYRSLMIWRADNKDIYVIIGEDTDGSRGSLLAYTDTWDDSLPAIHPDCAGMVAPSGYQLPVRGFGKVWCANDLEDDVGWPSTAETQVTLYVQPTQYGLLMKVTGTYVGRLIALHYPAMRAVTQFISP
ncbi:MAG: NBR1-Ig-like domain-containing protein [Anaerolineae bacterium]